MLVEEPPHAELMRSAIRAPTEVLRFLERFLATTSKTTDLKMLL